MIEAVLIKGNPSTVRLRIRGHAGAADKGADLICEDVTALWFTLLATAEEHRWQGEVKTGEGDCEIEIRLNRKNRKEVWTCLGVILAGLKMVARSFPDYVSYREDRSDP